MIKFSEQFPPFDTDVLIYSNGQYWVGKLYFSRPEDFHPDYSSSPLLVSSYNEGLILDPLHYSVNTKEYSAAEIYWQRLPEVTNDT